MRKYRGMPMVLVVLLMTAVMFGGGCGGGSDRMPAHPGEIQPGAEYEGVLSVQDGDEDRVLMRTRYEAHNIETGDSMEPVVALFVKQEEHLDEATGTMRVLSASEISRPTPEQVKAFLKDFWDAEHGGPADEGVNAREFLDFLAAHNMSLDQFFRYFEALDSSVSAFIDVIETYSTKLSSFDGKDIYGETESFCDLLGLELREYFQKIILVFGTHAAYCDKLVELGGIGKSTLYDAYSKWLLDQEVAPEDPFVGFLNYLKARSAEASGARPGGAAETALEVAKFAWDIIKDGKAQVTTDGAFTSVLRKDTTALDYGYAKRNETSIIHFKITDAWIKSWVLIETKFRGSASYDAVNPTFGGKYLQNVQFDVESAYAQWGMYLNVSAQVSNVTNPASVENPDPEIDVVARINAGWLFQSFGRSAYFRAKGSQGIWFQRWGDN